MNSINYSNLWWSADADLEREYRFYYKDYTRGNKGHGIRFIKGRIEDFLRFSHYKRNIILIKVEEYNIFEDQSYKDYNLVNASCISQDYDYYFMDEKKKRIKEKKFQKSNTYTRTNNNWNNCKNYNKKFR